MVKLLLALSFIICFLSCTGTKKVVTITNYQHLSFDKVKLGVKRQALGLNAKGYIHLDADSLIAFKFWGPLGLELIKGEYAASLNIYSYFEKAEHKHVEQMLYKEYKLRISRKSFEYLLTGERDELVNELNSINMPGSGIRISKVKDVVWIKNINSDKTISIAYKLKNNFPQMVFIELRNEKDVMKVEIEFVSVSNTTVKQD